MSTDPAKISDIEMRAQNLQSQQADMEKMPAAPAHKSGHHKKGSKKMAPAQ
jgi:phage gp16-like protein